MASPLRNLGAGLLRGTTADVLGMPVDTLNMLRQAMASPAAGGNPYARRIAGLLGPEMQTGSSDYFAQQMGLPQGQGLLYEGARMVSPSPTDLMTMARRVPIQELITYHGTPHRFEPTPANPLGEFEAAKIGTGEGRQVYGHGIYLAEAPEVAAGYRASVSPNAGEQFGLPDGPIKGIATMIAAKGDEGEKTARKVWGSSVDDIDEAVRMAKEAIAGKSSLYTADLPDEMIDRMLDWDKPLSEQPKAVRNAIESLKGQLTREDMENLGGDVNLLFGKDVTWAQFLNTWEALRGNTGVGEEMLRKAGIPGIKYLDQGSRDKGKGTRNFVVFPGEEKKVKILKRE